MLDTMQQAMIRVLDRIDAMELSHTHQPPAPAAPQEYVREQVRFGSPSDHMQRPVYEDARNAAQAAVAAAAGQMQPHASSPILTRAIGGRSGHARPYGAARDVPCGRAYLSAAVRSTASADACGPRHA